MSVFDSTMVDMAAKTAASAAPPAEDGKASSEGEPADAPDSKPAATDLIAGILEKHGLASAEELGEFIDSLAGLKGKIGDHKYG